MTNRNNKKFFFLVVILILTFSAINLYSANAGTGNIIDFDDFGDSDYGGSYDSDSGFGGGGFTFISGDLSIQQIIIVVIVIVVYNYVRKKMSESGKINEFQSKSRSQSDGASAQYPDRTESITETIQAEDENFSSKAFISWVKEVYSTLDEAFSSLQWDKVRPFESNEMYQTHQKQVDEYIRSNTRPKTERLFVNKVYFTKHDIDINYEYISVVIDARFQHYIVDSETNQIVKGNKDRVFYVKVIYEFKRSVGAMTNVDGEGFTTTNCPNCGGTLEITSSGKCEWCGSVITTGNYGWVLNDIQKISQH